MSDKKEEVKLDIARPTKVSKAKAKEKRKSRSERSGLVFPVGRIHRLLKKRNCAARVSVDAAVYIAASLEYLTAELVELSGALTHKRHRKRINPRAIADAVREDAELGKIVGNSIPREQSVAAPVSRTPPPV